MKYRSPPPVPSSGLKIACAKPTWMYELLGRTTKTGKKVISQTIPNPGIPNKAIERKCGQCSGCRIGRRMHLAMRLGHEAHQEKNAWFITATYDDDKLPEHESLCADHISRFVRTLRQKLARNGDKEKIRFFGIGEYGNTCAPHNGWTHTPDPRYPQCKTCTFGRPHLHLIMFGLKLPDKELVYTKQIRNVFNPALMALIDAVDTPGAKYYKSEILTQAWGKGIVQCTSVSEATMQYVAKFHVEKITGDKAEKHYIRLLAPEKPGDKPKIVNIEPETSRMSSNPAIGLRWLEKHWADIYPRGYIGGMDGAKFAPPPYYDKWYEKNHPEGYEILKAEREKNLNIELQLKGRRDALDANRNAIMRTYKTPDSL